MRFAWSVHPHPTPSHPFRLPREYIRELLRYAPIKIQFGPCCFPTHYLPSPIRLPVMERKMSKEAYDIFYTEIEERIMRVISEDGEDEEAKRKNGAPPHSVNGEKSQLFPSSDSFIDASRYGSFDMGMRQWQAPFGCGNWQDAWKMNELSKVRMTALASGRRGTGVFIPRTA